MIRLSHSPYHLLELVCAPPGREALRCRYVKTHVRSLTNVPVLSCWTIDTFRREAFIPQTPAVLALSNESLPQAITEWFFHHDGDGSGPRSQSPRRSELKPSFWRDHGQNIVSLEVTNSASSDSLSTTFDRIDAPLSVLLTHIERTSGEDHTSQSIYLAQHDLRDLPKVLQDDLPTPDLVKYAGKGDLYSSSLWLGRSPTYTPLHRDPNPNLFMQLAGTKVIRLFRPEIGDAIFDYTTKLINYAQNGQYGLSDQRTRSASFRGEEMMMGLERSILHNLIWEEPSPTNNNCTILRYVYEATVERGQALFIPKCWWHSVKGVGGGVTASANWWFR